MVKILDKQGIVETLSLLRKSLRQGQYYFNGDCDKFDNLLKLLRDFPQEISVNNSGNVVYATESKNINGDIRENVFATSFGRFVRRQLSLSEEHLPDRLLSMCTPYMTTDSFAVRVVQGIELFSAYQNRHIADTCLCGTNLVMLYAANPKNIKLIVMEGVDKSGDELGGRALLWHTDQGEKLVDTIYFGGRHNDPVFTRQIILNFAKSIGAKTISRNYHDQTVTVKDCPPYPYIDSFKYGERVGKNKIILNLEEGDLAFTSDYGCCYSHDETDEDWGELVCVRCKGTFSTIAENYGFKGINKPICGECREEANMEYRWCGVCEEFTKRKRSDLENCKECEDN